MIKPIKGFAIVTRQKPTLNMLNIYSKQQMENVDLEPTEYIVDIEIKVVPKRREMKF